MYNGRAQAYSMKVGSKRLEQQLRKDERHLQWLMVDNENRYCRRRLLLYSRNLQHVVLHPTGAIYLRV